MATYAAPPRTVFRNNFGAIRYILAFAIFLSHFNVITGSELWFPISGYYRVCSFFVISGFLIYGSFNRSVDWKDYLRNRAWRILPSYLIAVLGAAILLVYVSDMPPIDYFTDARWIKYVVYNAATLNFMQTSLPGVFEGNNITAVNGALWTMKVEWTLYLFIIPVILVSVKYGISILRIFVFIFLFSVIYKWTMMHLWDSTGSGLYFIMGRQMPAQLSFFYCGVLLSVYIDYVKRYKRIMWVISLGVLVAGMVWFNGQRMYDIVIFPVALSLFVVSVAFTGQWGRWAEMFENCSYEIYLFHFPLIQVAQHFHMCERVGTIPTFVAVLALTCALGYGVSTYISAPLRRSHRSVKRTLEANVI